MRLFQTAVFGFLASAAAAQDVALGSAIYGRYCATCHGIDAKGNGPMAPSLLLQPPNLTTLQARNDGVLPIARIVTRIDGRDPLVSHGSPMPVYGEFFEGTDAPVKAETGQPIMTSEPVLHLLAWLKTVQE